MVSWPVFRDVSMKLLSAGVDTLGGWSSSSATIIFLFYGSLQVCGQVCGSCVRCQTKTVSILPLLSF